MSYKGDEKGVFSTVFGEQNNDKCKDNSERWLVYRV